MKLYDKCHRGWHIGIKCGIVFQKQWEGHPERLADIEEQTEELVKLVPDHDVSALEFVKNQTDEICSVGVIKLFIETSKVSGIIRIDFLHPL